MKADVVLKSVGRFLSGNGVASTVLVLASVLCGFRADATTPYDYYVYVTEYWAHSVAVIKNFRKIGSLTTSTKDDSTCAIDITPDHSRIYLVNNRGRTVYAFVVDPESPDYGREIAKINTGGIPLSIRIHPDGLKAYVAAGQYIDIIDIDPDSPTYHSVIKKVLIPGVGFDLDFSPGGDQLFLAQDGSPPGNIQVLDTATDELIDTDGDSKNGVTPLSLGQYVGGSAWFRGFRVSPGGYGYILNSGNIETGYGSGNTISVFDTATYMPEDVDNNPETTSSGEPEGITSIVMPGILPIGASFTSDGSRLYVTQRDTAQETTSVRGKILLIDSDPSSPKFNQILKTAEAGVRPEGVAVSPDGKYVFVSCKNEYLVRFFDANLRVLGTFPTNYSGPMIVIQRPKAVRSVPSKK